MDNCGQLQTAADNYGHFLRIRIIFNANSLHWWKGIYLFIMGSLTGKFSKGILGDFIFKAAVWSTSCFKSSVRGTMKQSMKTERHKRTFVKVASLKKIRIFPSLKNSAEGLADLLSK
jgi:hypothetical protein